jgi:heme-degrading monooxygenase HmoA
MIVSVLPFKVRPGAVSELGEVFAENRILETAIQVEGCQVLVLASPDVDGDEAYVLGLWDDDAAYQRWMDHPERGAATDDLLKLMAGDFDPTAPAGKWQVLRAIYDAELAPVAKDT